MEIELPSVYVETSIVGYATSRPNAEPIVFGRQVETKKWWETAASRFDLYISKLVVDEVGGGDPEAATERLELLASVKRLEITEAMRALGNSIIAKLVLPPKAANDALHFAIASLGGIRYLATWNLKHLANASIIPRLEGVCEAAGIRPTKIVTLQFLEEEADEA